MKERKTILLVDDTPDNIKLLKSLLKDEFKTKIATNGEKALSIAFSDSPPDLILLDIMMPEMDGYEVCERLKSDDKTRDIPVIFLTAKAQMEDEQKGLEMGAVDYITKPISPPILITRVQTHLRLKNANDILKQQNELLMENTQLREDVERITRHDLKTPLNAIINFPKLMDKENLTEKQIEQLEKISKAGYKMLNMINLSLDLYKMEVRTYQFNPVPVDIFEVLHDIFQENRLFIRSRQITFNIFLNGLIAVEGTTFEVPGEKLLIYSMLANLLKNALEASPRKETITISIDKEPTPKISIHNKGAVLKEIKDTFFEKYSTAGKKTGTGLGTYSAKLIMETHGGSISMDSDEENGTEITISF